MKLFLITILAACSISSSFAQDYIDVKTKTFDFGVRLGINAYNIRAKNESSSVTSLYGGLFIEKRLSEKWGLQLEANYTDSELLNFPILLKYSITDKFEVYGGAELNFSLNQKNTQEVFRNKRYGTSLIFGTQYNINTHWFIEARYIHGLTNQFAIFQGFDNASIYGKRRSFNLGFGYKF